MIKRPGGKASKGKISFSFESVLVKIKRRTKLKIRVKQYLPDEKV